MSRAWFQTMIYSMSIAVAVVLTGCDSGGGDDDSESTSDAPPADVRGTWRGTLNFDVPDVQKGSQEVAFTISQNGNSLSGNVDGYGFSGSVDGNRVSLNADKYKYKGVDLEFNAHADFDGTYLINISGKAKAKIGGLTVKEGTVWGDRLTRD